MLVLIVSRSSSALFHGPLSRSSHHWAGNGWKNVYCQGKWTGGGPSILARIVVLFTLKTVVPYRSMDSSSGLDQEVPVFVGSSFFWTSGGKTSSSNFWLNMEVVLTSSTEGFSKRTVTPGVKQGFKLNGLGTFRRTQNTISTDLH